MIAQVGGFLGCKSDGEPGAKTIWRGLDQVFAAAETLRALLEGLGLMCKDMTLSESELNDPLLRDPIIDSWDGLCGWWRKCETVENPTRM